MLLGRAAGCYGPVGPSSRQAGTTWLAAERVPHDDIREPRTNSPLSSARARALNLARWPWAESQDESANATGGGLTVSLHASTHTWRQGARCGHVGERQRRGDPSTTTETSLFGTGLARR